jgi:hypothetical protein
MGAAETPDPARRSRPATANVLIFSLVVIEDSIEPCKARIDP